jgi:HK97 family phage major capsid protein
MALRALSLRREIDRKTKELEALRAKDADFESRNAELEKAIEEVNTDEEQETVNEAVTALETEREAHEAAKAELEDKVRELEKELKAEEAKNEAPAVPAEANTTRQEDLKMETREMNLSQLPHVERAAIMERDDVKSWIGEIRAHIAEKRELTNIGLTIPEVFLGYLRENILQYSKLYKRITVRAISGTGREVIMGSIPEGIWMECCGTLNELSLTFNDAEVDCFKVGGYFKVCNAVLEDSDLNLASELLTAIGQAIGLALDKAILYGRNASGTQKMPMGIMSRLVQTEAPSGYPATARQWVDLHTSNIITIDDAVTGISLFQQILIASGAAKGKYARGPKTWVMNETTYTYLKAQAMSVNAAGAIVSGLEGSMPVVGGVVEVLDFIPDNVIIGGYFELYLLAERAGTKFAQSEHAFFVQDQTAFKGTARYDGQPVIPEGFVAIGLNDVTPSATMSFAPDTVNP